MHKKAEDRIFSLVIGFAMTLVVVLTVYPFWYILIQSFNDGQDSIRGGIYFLPRVFSIDNYSTLLADSSWLNGIVISVGRTVLGTALGVLFTGMVGYAMSFDELRGRKIFFRIMIFTMYFSGGMIPFYIVLRSLHLLNTFWVYVVPGMLNVYFMLIMINFYRELPRAMYESAWLDGAGDMTVFFRIVLPLSKASLATIALFFAVNQWNAWLDSVYYVNNSNLRPIAYLMMEIINQSDAQKTVTDAVAQGYASSAISATTKSLQMAAMMISVAPILVVYPFLQKYFVKGVLIGSVKG